MNSRQKVYEMLDEFQFAMLVTKAAGELASRPMQLAEVEPAGSIWLLTSERSRKIDQIRHDPQVLLTFQDGQSQSLSLRGRARAVEDPGRVKRLWSEPARVWFPDGPDDPDIVLIEVQPEAAEFWDTTGTNRFEYLWEAAKAYVTGERLSDGGEQDDMHGRTRL
jgi:general stress protein 26